MVYGQYDKDKAALQQPAADLGRSSKDYVPESDRRHAQMLASAVSTGMMPHNQQLTEILDRIDASLGAQVGTAQLSSEGEKVAQNLQSVVSATRDAIEEKNQDELLQKIVYTTGRATQVLATDPTAQERARVVAATAPTRQTLLEGINNLARQLSTSSQFRLILFQLNALVRELLFDEDTWDSGDQQQQQQQYGGVQQQQQQQYGDVRQRPMAVPESEGLYGMSYGQLPTSSSSYGVGTSGVGASSASGSSLGSSLYDPTYGQFTNYSQGPSFGQGQQVPSFDKGQQVSSFDKGQQQFGQGQQVPSFDKGQQQFDKGQQQFGQGQQQFGQGQQQFGQGQQQFGQGQQVRMGPCALLVAAAPSFCSSAG